MSKKKRGELGRKIDALLGDLAQEVLERQNEMLRHINTANLRLVGKSWRENENSAEQLQPLAQSLLKHGMLQPLLVRPLGEYQYAIIAGRRRFLAAQLIGLKTLPCLVRHGDDPKDMALQITENLHRVNLSQHELAAAIDAFAQQFDLSDAQVGQYLACSTETIAKFRELNTEHQDKE